jgi:hypothetical protein
MTDEKTLAGHAKILKVALKTTLPKMDKEYSYGPIPVMFVLK